MARKIILASHGNLASGMANTLKFIIGEVSDIENLCAYTTSDFNLEVSVKNILNRCCVKDCEVIVFTDVYGGSVNNEFMKYLQQYSFILISNMNLAVILQVLISGKEWNKTMINLLVNDENARPKFCNDIYEKFFEAETL